MKSDSLSSFRYPRYKSKSLFFMTITIDDKSFRRQKELKVEKESLQKKAFEIQFR